VAEVACDVAGAFMALSTGDLTGAAGELERPLQLLATLPDSYVVPHTLGCAAIVFAQRGDPDAAQLGARAVTAARRFPARQVLIMALSRAAEATVLSGSRPDARPLVVELVETLRHVGARRWVAEAHELAAIVFGDDQPDTAAIALGAAARLRRELDEPSGPAFLLGEALEGARQRIAAALGPDMARHLATGAGVPVDEALATVAARLFLSIDVVDREVLPGAFLES